MWEIISMTWLKVDWIPFFEHLTDFTRLHLTKKRPEPDNPLIQSVPRGDLIYNILDLVGIPYALPLSLLYNVAEIETVLWQKVDVSK